MKAIPFVLAALVIATAIPAWVLPYLGTGQTTTAEAPNLLEVMIAGSDDAMSKARQVDELRLVSAVKDRDPYQFSIAEVNGRWVIPSHHNYPADSGAKVGEVAGSVLDIRPGRLVSEDPARFAEFGVVDPENTVEKEGHGIRVTLKYGQGKVLADLVIGNRVDNEWKNRYVRKAAGKQVFVAELNLDLKTDFTEWVERDLLKIERDDLRQIVIENYKVDENAGTVVPVSSTIFKREKADTDWMVAETPDGKVLDQDKVRTMLYGINDLRISGVRLIDKDNFRQMQYYGFFSEPTTNRLFGNEGCNHLVTKDGLYYRIYFGEVAVGEGQVLSAGEKVDPAAPGATKPTTGEYRYVTVYVNYLEQNDQEFLAIADDPPPAKPDEAKPDGTKPDTTAADATKPATPNPDVTKTDATKPPEKQLTAEERRAKRREEMTAKAQKTGDRFARFVYVISDGAFKKLRPDHATFFKDPEQPKDPKAGEKAGAKQD